MALINRREFEYLEADSASTPRGIVFLLDMYGKWIYNEDRVFETFKGTEVFAKLREMINDGSFERIAREKFLDTDNWAYVTLLPKKGLGEERDAELVQQLSEKKAALSKEEFEKIEEDAKKLEKYRETPDSDEALATIPTLLREDMTKTVLPVSNIERKIGNVPVWQHDYSGNGIVYIRLFFDLAGIKEEEIAPVSLITKILSQVDTEKFSYSELDDEINLVSGGISFGCECFANADDPDNYREYFRVKTKAKEDKLADVAGLIREILLNSKFDDKKHVYDMLNMVRSGLEYRLEGAGHVTGRLRSSATIKQKNYFDLKSGGIDFYKYVDALLNDFDNRYPELCRQFEELCSQIFTKGNLIVSVTAQDKAYSEFEKGFAELINGLPAEGRFGKAEKMEEFVLPKGNEAFYTAGQVTYTSLVGECKDDLVKTGYAKVLTTILNNDLLYPEIRVKGGAYGAFGSFFASDELISMSTYRDSKVKESVEVFKKAADFVRDFEANEEQMTKYIIGTMSSDDFPLNPRQRGERSFDWMMRKLPTERAQRWRDELLSTTAEDIRKFAPVLEKVVANGTLTSVGNESILRENAALFDRISPLLREEKK
ncbi:MAG: hypothetical protein J6113_08050, partial [Lachnospiraceae bacterium]|nr:hypothetical protein [Lachnospiraceae bacterium]